MDEVKLLPCPFCDGEAQLRDPHAAFSHLAAVFCNECEIRGQLSVDAEQAIIFWNTRSTLVTDELVERVATALVECGIYPRGRLVAFSRDAYLTWARAAIAAMPTLVTGQLDQGWQPIETAPKDGTGVLVICMGAERPSAGEGWFIGGKWTTLDPECSEEFGEDFYHASTWMDPTHWQPLPEPPAHPQPGPSQ